VTASYLNCIWAKSTLQDPVFRLDISTMTRQLDAHLPMDDSEAVILGFFSQANSIFMGVVTT
jgi:hypothetical protein